MGCVIVTGAAGALGSAVCRRIVKDGRNAAMLDTARAEASLAAMAGELGDAARGYVADISSAGAWEELLPRIEKDLGSVDGAVLVAGGWRGGKPLHESEAATWDAMLSMNLHTARESLRAILPGMVANKRGSVVVIGSRAVEQPWTSAGAADYAATKAAVVAMARAAAAEVLHDGVRINAVMPSTLDTPANRRAMPKVDPAAWVATDSCAAVIAFLLSDESRDVSGAAIPVYGRA